MSATEPMSHNLPFKSETKTANLGQPLELFDFVPMRGPSGGRVVIDQFVICISGTITVAAANWLGEDICRLLGGVTVEDRAGKNRWNLSGFKSRQASIMFNGITRHTEHADIAIGAAAAVDYRLIIPMTKPLVRRGKDFALPADLLKKVVLNFNSLSGAATGATVLSVPALNVYVLAEYHEEDSVEVKSEDLVKSVDFNSNTQAKISCSGAVHDAFITKEDTTAGGGTSLAAITDVRCEDMGTPLLTRGDLVHSYRAKRGYGASGPATPGTERYLEPVISGFVVPFIVADEDTSVWEGRVLETMKIDVGTGLAGLSIVTREVTEKSQANFAAVQARFKINADIIRMKTAGKTRRGLGDGWSPRAQVVAPWSAPLPRIA